MKPKSMFYDEKHSTTNFWNNSNIIRWNRECIDNGKSQLNLQTFVKIVILIIILIFLGVLLLSWLSTSQQQLTTTPAHQDGQQHATSSFDLNDDASSAEATESAPTSSQPPKSQSSSTVTEAEPIDAINLQRSTEFVPSSTSRSGSGPSDSISNSFDEPATEKSSYNADDDALLLTKKYVRK